MKNAVKNIAILFFGIFILFVSSCEKEKQEISFSLSPNDVDTTSGNTFMARFLSAKYCSAFYPIVSDSFQVGNNTDSLLTFETIKIKSIESIAGIDSSEILGIKTAKQQNIQISINDIFSASSPFYSGYTGSTNLYLLQIKDSIGQIIDVVDIPFAVTKNVGKIKTDYHRTILADTGYYYGFAVYGTEIFNESAAGDPEGYIAVNLPDSTPTTP